MLAYAFDKKQSFSKVKRKLVGLLLFKMNSHSAFKEEASPGLPRDAS